MFNIPEQVAQTPFVENDQYDADNKINNQLTLIFICQNITLQICNIIKSLHDKGNSVGCRIHCFLFFVRKVEVLGGFYD